MSRSFMDGEDPSRNPLYALPTLRTAGASGSAIAVPKLNREAQAGAGVVPAHRPCRLFASVAGRPPRSSLDGSTSTTRRRQGPPLGLRPSPATALAGGQESLRA